MAPSGNPESFLYGFKPDFAGSELHFDTLMFRGYIMVS
jgi:hypothetical protein